MIKKGSELEVTIDDVRFPNIGIVNSEEKEIRIKGGLKGTKAIIRIQKKRSKYAQAKIHEIVEESSLVTEEGCPHFGKCGGCTYQKLSYENELDYKLLQVQNLFSKADIDVEIDGIEPSPIIKGYRNKMEFTFGDEYRDGPLSLGMHRRNSFYEIETVEHCNIADEDFSTILMNSLEYFRELGLEFYHKKRHIGVLRNVVVRKALSTGEILVNLVTTSQEEIDLKAYSEMILSLSDSLKGRVVGIYHTINDGVADIIRADESHKIWGQEYITEEICGLKFRISPFSFFQTNTFAAEKLYGIAQEFIGDIENKTVFDLYSGTGTIAQIMAQVADKVVAVELVEEAVEKARENADLNSLTNIEFHAGDVFKVVDELDIKPDLIVIDPPRPGLEKAVNKIIDFNPERFIYISCNPTTLVTDLKVFMERGYRLEKVKLMDQFPRTPHVEVVTLLTRI